MLTLLDEPAQREFEGWGGRPRVGPARQAGASRTTPAPPARRGPGSTWRGRAVRRHRRLERESAPRQIRGWSPRGGTGLGMAPSSRRTRLCSTSRWRIGSTSSPGSPPATDCAASSVKPPTNMARPTKDGLLVRVQQAVAPGDRITHRLLASRRITRAIDQERQALLEAVPQFGCREHRIRAAANSIASGNPSRVWQIAATCWSELVATENRGRQRAPLDEEPHCRVVGPTAVRVRGVQGRQGERLHRQLLLAPNAQWGPARGQHVHGWARGE